MLPTQISQVYPERVCDFITLDGGASGLGSLLQERVAFGRQAERGLLGDMDFSVSGHMETDPGPHFALTDWLTCLYNVSKRPSRS